MRTSGITGGEATKTVDMETLSEDSSCVHEKMPDFTPLRCVEDSMGNTLATDETELKPCPVAKIVTIRLKAPTFMTLGINREADSVRVPEWVGVDIDTPTTRNRDVVESKELAEETVRCTLRL